MNSRSQIHVCRIVVALAAGLAPHAAAMQEGTSTPSAAPRPVAATPTVTPSRSTGDARVDQQQALKFYDSLLGEVGGVAALTESVLVIPSKPMDGQALGQVVEDLSVMSRIIEKNALGEDAGSAGVWGIMEYKGYMPSWSGVAPATVFPPTGRAKPMYLGGYGAIFFIQVAYPLLPPPEVPQEQPSNQQEDPVWAEARRSLLEPQARPQVLPQDGAEPAEPYSREQVDALRSALVTALKHATNIRVLEPDEWVVIVVQGVAPAPQARPTPAGRTVLTLRATKADVDQYAKGQFDPQQFTQRVQTITY
jgi:hypothetical protein